MKCYRKILRIPWMAHRTNCSILNEFHLPTNWLYNIVRRQKLKNFGHVTRHNGLEKTIRQGMVAGKRSQDKDGRKTSQIRLVRWQQQAQWRRTGIHFAETSGQRRLDEDMLREERKYHIMCTTGWSVLDPNNCLSTTIHPVHFITVYTLLLCRPTDNRIRRIWHIVSARQIQSLRNLTLYGKLCLRDDKNASFV